VDQRQFIDFVRHRGLAVIATRGADGAPQAALIGITATERGELVFDTSRGSRKYHNLSAFAQVALVIGWDNEMTVQCEGTADIPTGADRDRCLQAYLAQYPEGAERAHDPDIVHVRVRRSWLRYSDYRPRVIHHRGDHSGTLTPRRPSDTTSRKRFDLRHAPQRRCTAKPSVSDGSPDPLTTRRLIPRS
jgi:general stress protein 26